MSVEQTIKELDRIAADSNSLWGRVEGLKRRLIEEHKIPDDRLEEWGVWNQRGDDER